MDEFITAMIVLLSLLMALVMATPIEGQVVTTKVSDKSISKVDQKVVDMLIIVDPESMDLEEVPER